MKNAKRYKGFTLLAILVVLCIAMLAAWLLILGKSGLMEMIPNSLLTLLLMYINFFMPVRPKETKLQTQPEPEAAEQK